LIQVARKLGAMTGEQVSSAPLSPCSQPLPPSISSATSQIHRPAAISASDHAPGYAPKGAYSSRPNSLPFSFPPLFSQPTNPSSPSLVPAEGKPIPLNDSTAAHRTSALRELNSNYPSPVNRHRYAKSTGAQSSTYSQPVIVRTYSGPAPLNSGSTGYPYHPSSASRGGSRRVPLTPALRAGPTKLTISGANSPSTGSGNGRAVVSNMPRIPAKKRKLPWQWPLGAGQREQEAQLPPLEAFSFKSFLEGLDTENGGGNGGISADLDRIAEICARSRYSLSNQYEVHVAPHGSGAGFPSDRSSLSGVRRRGGSRQGSTAGGPTLQAIGPDDDDRTTSTQRKRRSGMRRKSVAYGTLETIMSSSRSSEEDKTKKKSAAEIAEEVRGRAARKQGERTIGPALGVTAGSGSGDLSRRKPVDPPGQAVIVQGERRMSRRSSASFANALMENKKQATGQKETTSPRGSAPALVSEPARPQTSTSHLQIRTAPDVMPAEDHANQTEEPASPHSEHIDVHADIVSRTEDQETQSEGLSSGWGAWFSWKAPSSNGESVSHRRASKAPSHAEGSLRQLLSTVEVKDKGKAVSRQGQDSSLTSVPCEALDALID
jgi:hypothetical protein